MNRLPTSAVLWCGWTRRRFFGFPRRPLTNNCKKGTNTTHRYSHRSGRSGNGMPGKPLWQPLIYDLLSVLCI